MVQEVLGIAFSTGSTIWATISEVYHDINVPPTLRTVRGDFVYGGL